MAIIIGTDPQVVIASNDNPVFIHTGGAQGAQGIQGVKGDKGDKGDAGDTGNFTGLAGFTDANGFIGNITNNNLSLTLQDASSTQSGQLTPSSFNEFTAKGTSNLTLGSTNITAFQGDLGTLAVSNITALQGNVTGLQNLTTTLSSDANTTNSILNGATSNITVLQNQTVNLSESKLNITDALTIGSTNLTAYRGDLGVAATDNITTLQGDLTNHTSNISNPHNVTKTQIGLPNVTDVAPLELPISNLTQTALNAKQATLVSATNIKTINGASILGSGDMIITGGGNISGIAGFTDGGGFTGTVTNNSLSLIMQYANTTQDGQITSGKFTDWESKGSSNLTLGNTGTTALKGNATTADVAASTDKNYVTDAKLTVLNQTSNTNTGDQDLSALALKATTINGVNLSANINLTTANISASTDKNYVTDSQLVNVTNLTGTNTGDQNITLSGDISGTGTGNITVTLATVNSNVGLFGNATIVPTIVFNGKGLATSVSNNTIPTANTSVGGLLTSADWNTFNSKGTSNLTVGSTTGTAFDGALGAGAASNITTLQGNVTNLTTDVNALNSAMRYIGGWDASTGAFPASTEAGYVYSVTVDGTVDGIDFVATDRLLSILDNASTTTYAGNWLKEDYTDKVISVNGQVGTVSLTTANITASTDNNYVTDAMLSKINQTAANSNVTYVQGNGTVNGVTLTGNVTSGGNLTLGGSLSGTAPALTVGNTTNIPALSGAVTGNATGVTSLTANGITSAQLASAVTDETGTGVLVFSTSPTLVTPLLGTPTSINLTNAVGANLTSAVVGTLPVANGGTGVTTSTGSGNAVLSTSPTLVTPVLGTPTSGTLTNCGGIAPALTAGNVTNIPALSGVITGNSTGTTTLTANGVTSANLLAWVSDETGTGLNVFANNCTLNTPNLTTPSFINLTNAIGTAPSLTAGNVTTVPILSGVVTGNSTGVTTLTANGTTSAQLAASLTDETGTGSNVFNTNCTLVTPNLGTPSTINLTNAVGLPTATPIYNGGYDVSGWFAIGACAYVSADSPTFVMNMTGDATGYLSLGNRIKLTQTTVKYFVITAIGAYSGGVTPITLYGGTDYTLANAAITLPYFSTHKSPFGFPLNPIKWDWVVTDSATSPTQATPTIDTYYNLGTTTCQITVPIGAWDLSYQVLARGVSTSAQVAANIFTALSTSNTSVSDIDLAGQIADVGASAAITSAGVIFRTKNILLTTKQLYYLIAKTNQSTSASITFVNQAASMVLRAKFMYL